LQFTWQREIMHTIPSLSSVVLTGLREKRIKLLDEMHDIYIINHDGVKVILPFLMARKDIDVIAFDEAAAYRNSRSDRAKLAKELSKDKSYVWGMTGSPTPSSPTDAFGLSRLITPASSPRSFTHFRADTMLQVSQFKWLPRNDAADTVSRLLQPSVRYTLDDLVELPPVIYRDMKVALGTRQKNAYETLKNQASVMLKEGTVTANNGGILFNKLLQVSVGWLYDNDGKTIDLDNDQRMLTLLDIIESAERKVIVFSPYKSATAGISKRLEKEKIEFATVTGDTPAGERGQIFTAFQGTAKYRVLNAHPECMSHGLTLTAADTIVWFGPTTKLETYEQANARITRVGQAHKQQVIRLIGSNAEKMVYKRLELKESLQANVLELLAELTGANT
jgi:SNF2 family DNA or RNA helicase